MLNKLSAFAAQHRMLTPGDRVVCAVSGGADSMALLWALYLLREKLQISLCAAHFNHRLRGEESDRDEAFVARFCKDYGIEFFSGSAQVSPGPKGLEAAAREARYAFLQTLPGKVATAHTASDNAETVLMHLVRGTGLKGLGGIMPVNGRLIRPMLGITRSEVLAFLQEYSIPFVEDSSNAGDAFLRNRLRHRVMPLLEAENPSLACNLSAMAQRLREDEAALDRLAEQEKTNSVPALLALDPAIRSRVLAKLLLDAGVKEPEAQHILALEKLLISQKPSARAQFPGGVRIARNYDVLEPCLQQAELPEQNLPCPGCIDLPQSGVRIRCERNISDVRTYDSFSFVPEGSIVVRSRREGDVLTLSGGTKSLKKLFIDQKIPAAQRAFVPVIADDAGVVGAAGFGCSLPRLATGENAVRITIETI